MGHKPAKVWIALAAALVVGACDIARTPSSDGASKTVVVYDNESIEPNIAMWNPSGIPVDGFRFANVFVEFEQKTPQERPLTVGVGFGPWENGRAGTRNVYDFSVRSGAAPQAMDMDSTAGRPTWISGYGAETWHGEQGIASYAVRTPVIGPYMWVYPLNNHDKARRFTVVVYLTK